MLLRVERLRQAVIRMHGELQKNRSSLQGIRQSYQGSRAEAEPEQSFNNDKMLALPASPSSPVIPNQTRPTISITCDVSAPIFTAELKDVLDREAEIEDGADFQLAGAAWNPRPFTPARGI